MNGARKKRPIASVLIRIMGRVKMCVVAQVRKRSRISNAIPNLRQEIERQESMMCPSMRNRDHNMS